jgi:hypothetical protein
MSAIPDSVQLREALARLPAPTAGPMLREMERSLGDSPILERFKKRMDTPEFQAALRDPDIDCFLRELHDRPQEIVENPPDPRFKRLLMVMFGKDPAEGK